jgi:uncharacterized membrane protein YedE/YeeE
MQVCAALICGLIFGWGLLISGMLQPTKVIGFLDIFGIWDPSLAVVMAAALVVSGAGFRIVAAREQPLLTAQRMWPTKTDVDPPLMIGATLFGVGWGLVGLCPGPALENLATLSPRVIAFVVAMAFGMIFYGLWDEQRPGLRRSRAAITVSGDG